VIFDLYRKPLVMGVEPFAHRPGFENAIQLQAQIIVQAGGVVFLDDEAGTVVGLTGSWPLGSRVYRKSRFAL
jgi:hypothetical protein